MTMNKNIWNWYKNTDDYRSLVKLFDPEDGDTMTKYYEVADFMKEKGLFTEIDPSQIGDNCVDFMLNFSHQGFAFPEEMTREWYEDYVNRSELRYIEYKDDGSFEFDGSPKGLLVRSGDFRDKNACVCFISICFYFTHCFFKPMLCQSTFHLIVRNCERLGIELPEYPRARDYKAFMMWYYDFCEALNAFQDGNDLSDAELCACLYGFASGMGDEEPAAGMPKPINVWMTGASGEDYDHLEKLDPGYNLWACNENTRRGDIVVIYATSPHSHIHSIWRANSEGVFNPFDYYQARTHIADGVKVPHISLKEMKDDPVFGKLPMLNNNLQGLNGKRLPAWAYQRLLEMIGERGGDLSLVPVLYETHDWNPGEIRLEKDVEEKILIPCLKDLGYTERDWTRQLSQKAGRSEKAIPDFAFFPHGEVHAENAPLVIEAKLRIGSERERMEAYKQARSYAKMLDSEMLGICDQERLVLFRRNERKEFDYTRPCFEAHWAAIVGDVDTHDELMRLAGADVVRRMVR